MSKPARFPLTGVTFDVPDDATSASMFMFDSTEPTETIYFDDDLDDSYPERKAQTMPSLNGDVT